MFILHYAGYIFRVNTGKFEWLATSSPILLLPNRKWESGFFPLVGKARISKLPVLAQFIAEFLDVVVDRPGCDLEKSGYLLLEHNGFSFKRNAGDACCSLYFL